MDISEGINFNNTGYTASIELLLRRDPFITCNSGTAISKTHTLAK
jgi:hypothetical protein